MGKKSWNIKRLVDDSFVPTAQRTSVLYVLTDFFHNKHSTAFFTKIKPTLGVLVKQLFKRLLQCSAVANTANLIFFCGAETPQPRELIQQVWMPPGPTKWMHSNIQAFFMHLI